MEILKGRTSIRPIPNTTLIQIRAFDDVPDDAAIVANSLAKVYTSYVMTNGGVVKAEIIDLAYANKAPVAPNKTVNCLWGIVIGVLLGLMAATGIVLIYHINNNRELS